MNEKPVRIGVSSCLLGMKVRFDGNHKLDHYLTEVLDTYFEFIPSCPEVEIGMSIPRETIRLVGKSGNPKLVAPGSGNDYTDEMNRYSKKRIEYLSKKRIHGYIFKSNSPTCGMERVRVYDKNNVPSKNGVGLFARVLMENNPLLPFEEEGRLRDTNIRENFIERVFAYYNLQELISRQPNAAKIVAFHTRNKMLLMAHNVSIYREMGRLVAQAGKEETGEFLDKYSKLYMHAFNTKATKKKHANVLFHLIGHLKKVIDPDLQKDLVRQIDYYRNGQVPLIVPITLIRHHLVNRNAEWLKSQTYLNPYPEELMLRNHV